MLRLCGSDRPQGSSSVANVKQELLLLRVVSLGLFAVFGRTVYGKTLFKDSELLGRSRGDVF